MSHDEDHSSNETDSGLTESIGHHTDVDTSSSELHNNQKEKPRVPNTKYHHNDSSSNTDNAEEYESEEDSFEDGSISTATDDTDEDEDSTENDLDNTDKSLPNSHSAALIQLSNEEDDDDEDIDDNDDNDDDDSESEHETTDDDDDDYDYEDDDEEAEPQLKYQRLGGGLSSMMMNDSASTLKCHPRFLVLGMVSGTVYVLDPHGDIIKQYRAHTSNAVNDISIDQNGDHVATCSKDGRVVIRDIFKDVQTVHNFRNQDLLSIELHPSYGTQQMFVTGGRGQQLLLRSIGFFRSDNKVLHSGEGAIYCIAWQCELIAWANDRGVKIFDISDHKPIAHINRSNRGSPDPERYKCCLCWENRETLLIGWGDWVKIGRIRTVRTQQGHVMKEVHVTNVFITDFYICGIAPFKEHLILLAFLENDDDESTDNDEDDDNKDIDSGIGTSKPPELRIVSRRGEWIATDALPIYKYKANQAKDYKLVWSHDDVEWVQGDTFYDAYSSLNRENADMDSRNVDETFYIVSPSDIVASLPRTVEDHIKWLWEKEEYEVAWRQSVLYSDDLIRSKLNPTSLGEEFLKYVLEEDEKCHDRFGDLMAEVCLKNGALWEKWIDILSDKGKLNLIINVIPKNNPVLKKRSYELVLNELIKNDHNKFLECVTEWNSGLYDIKRILFSATNRLNEIRRSDPLIQALAQLFTLDQEFDKALEYYLQLKCQLLLHCPQRYDIVYLMKSNSDYKYLRNETIDAMIELDEKEKYNDKLKKVRYLLKENDHLNNDYNEQRRLNEELNKISSAVFTMIIRHKLWLNIQHKIISLIELDIFRASKLFIEYRDDIHEKGPNFIIEQVTLRISEVDQQSKCNKSRSKYKNNRNHNCQFKSVSPSIYKKYLKFFMYLYLHELVGCNDGSQYPEFHDYLVALYAEFNTKQLNNFLAVSHHVKFSKALAVCEKRLAQTADPIVCRNLNECYVFILNRMGNFTEALQVILIRLEDVEKAVKFVEKQSDKSLWNHLIERTLRDAKSLMPKLLDAVKGHPNVDAQELIQKIPNNLHIQGLKPKIIAIFEEYSREKLLTKGTTDILKSDCLKLGNKLYREANRGVCVNRKCDKCIICQLPLNVYPSHYKEHMARIQSMEQLQKLTKDIGSTRLNIKKNNNQNNKNLNLNELSNTLPSIKVFYCRHFYHVDCYREGQYDKKYSISPKDIDKCLICFSRSAQTKKRRR